MLKKNKPFLLVTLGAAVLLIGGGVAAYFLLPQRNRFLADAPAELVPQDALLTASISTNSEQWQQLREYGTLETQSALDKQLTQMENALLTANGYNYEQDIKPWLGKTVMISYLKLPSTDSSYLPDLIVLPIVNPTQAQQLLEKTKSQKTTQFVERTYKNIQIRETQKSNSQNYSVAVLGRFLVVTNNPKITERVIDTYKGAASVAATPRYTEELGKINASNPFAQLYLNVPAYLASVAVNSRRSLSPQKVAAEQQRQGLAATVTLEPEGIRFQGISWLKPKSTQKNEVENSTSRLVRRLPADTLLMISGGNLARLWQDYAKEADFNPLIPIPPAAINAGLKATLDVDLEGDILPGMGGEFSLALIPASPDVLTLPGNQQSPQLGAGVVLMVEASDRSRAEATLKQMDQVMATRYQFQVEETKLGDQPVVNWTSPLGGVSATHGWLEGNVVFLTLGAPIAGEIVTQPQASLTQTPLFQKAVPTKLNPKNGQFFLDVERTINKGSLNLPPLPPEQKMLAKAIRSIGVTGAVSDKRTNRFDLFVQLKTALAPSVSPNIEPSVSPPSRPSLPQIPQTPQRSLSSPSAPTPQIDPGPQTPPISPSGSPTPQTPQTPPISPSGSPTLQTPQTPPSSPSGSPTLQTPQTRPNSSP